MTYDMLSKLALLDPNPKDRTKYYCPNCSGNDLAVKTDGKYNCFNGCSPEDIRKAIDQLEGKVDTWMKKERPAQKVEQVWYYPSRDGTPLAAVKRIDDGKGNRKFSQGHYNERGVLVGGNPDGIKQSIPNYNYSAIQLAIKTGLTVYWCEGEKTADALIALGLSATTTIGGSGGFNSYGDYSKDFDGAKVVICPDKDLQGLKYAADVAAMLGNRVIGYYLCGEIGAWRNPAGGMDIADEIVDYKLTADKIEAKVITPDRFEKLTSQLPDKQLDIKEVIKHSEVEDELVEEWNIEELAVEQGYRDANKDFDPSLYFPQQLADVITIDGHILCVDPVSFLAYILPAAASLMGHTGLDVGSHTIPNIVWSILIAEPGLGKSRVHSVCTKKLAEWDRFDEITWRRSFEVYQANAINNKKQGDFMSGDPAVPPARRVSLIEDATMGALLKNLIEGGTSSALWADDEAAATLKGFDRFAKDGNDKTLFLKLWNGESFAKMRMDSASSGRIAGSRISFTGGMQPSVFADTFKVDDGDGFLSRFLPIIPRDDIYQKSFNQRPGLIAELSSLFKTIRYSPGYSWPTVSIDAECAELWATQTEYYMNTKVANKPLQYWLRKAPSHLGRVALALHAIECHYDDSKAHSELTADTLARAIGIIGIAADNVAMLTNSLNATADGTTQVMAAIVKKLQGSPKGMTPRQIVQYIRSVRSAAKLEGLTSTVYTRKLLKSMRAKGLVRFDDTTAFKI